MSVFWSIEITFTVEFNGFNYVCCPKFRTGSIYAMLGLGLLDALCRRKGLKNEKEILSQTEKFIVTIKKAAKYSGKIKTFHKLVRVIEERENSEEALKTLYYYIENKSFGVMEAIIEFVKLVITLTTFEKILREAVENGYLMNDFLIVKSVQVFSDYFGVCVFYYKDSDLLTKILPGQGEVWPVIFLLQDRLSCFKLLLPSEFSDRQIHNFSQFPFLYPHYEDFVQDVSNDDNEEIEIKSEEEQSLSETIENSSKDEESRIYFSEDEVKKPNKEITTELGCIKELRLNQRIIKDEHLDLTIYKIDRLYRNN